MTAPAKLSNMNSSPQIRLANKQDLPALLQIENEVFQSDRLSKRSFAHFIKGEHSDLGVLELNQEIVGYALILYRRGTHLARLYSLAILPSHQGKGLASRLMTWCEAQALEKGCVFLRLEVSEQNQTALALYQKRNFQRLTKLEHYYEDGSHGWRMEKRLLPHRLATRPNFYYYAQTTEFTCGPASLLMVLKTLYPDTLVDRHQELQIWREATTIFMTSGHGGCSPHGLALSAWRRGLQVKLFVSSASTPFIDSVRSADKKAVIELVHHDFLQQIQATDIEVEDRFDLQHALENHLSQKLPILALISTWQFNRNKAPHWVVITAGDDEFVYLNDPDMETLAEDLLHSGIPEPPEPYSQTDFEMIPIRKNVFWQMARFGQQKLQAFIVLSRRET